MRESKVEARLVRGVEARGGLCWKFISPGRAGVPDRLVLLPGGRAALVELKQKTGRLSAIQRARREELRAVGADVWVLYGPEDVDRFLKTCGTPQNSAETALWAAQSDFRCVYTPEAGRASAGDYRRFTKGR